MEKLKVCALGFLLLWSAALCADDTNTVIATIPVGQTPAGIAVTPNSLYAYVANNNNAGIPGADTVSVLNLTNNTLQQTISDSSFREPYTVTINAAGTKAYVTNSGGSTVTIIDLTTNTVTGTIDGFGSPYGGPSGFVITPDGNYAYVTNFGDGTTAEGAAVPAAGPAQAARGPGGNGQFVPAIGLPRLLARGALCPGVRADELPVHDR